MLLKSIAPCIIQVKFLHHHVLYSVSLLLVTEFSFIFKAIIYYFGFNRSD